MPKKSKLWMLQIQRAARMHEVEKWKKETNLQYKVRNNIEVKVPKTDTPKNSIIIEGEVPIYADKYSVEIETGPGLSIYNTVLEELLDMANRLHLPQIGPEQLSSLNQKQNSLETKNTARSLQVEKSSNLDEVFTIEGRRFIDIAHFYRKIKDIAKHGCMDCGLESVDIVGERKEGLHSLFTLKCQMCSTKFYLHNDPLTEININHCAVAGTIAIG